MAGWLSLPEKLLQWLACCEFVDQALKQLVSTDV